MLISERTEGPFIIDECTVN
uniref:Uncharacterized protein n=1 Tax=Anguilla anguilla TaxID=7936 RepID=A0A0E9QKJ1_ANGAN